MLNECMDLARAPKKKKNMVIITNIHFDKTIRLLASQDSQESAQMPCQ